MTPALRDDLGRCARCGADVPIPAGLQAHAVFCTTCGPIIERELTAAGLLVPISQLGRPVKDGPPVTPPELVDDLSTPIPTELIHDSPDNPRRRPGRGWLGGVDVGEGDFTAYVNPQDILPEPDEPLRGLSDSIGTITGRLTPEDLARWFGVPSEALAGIAPRLTLTLRADFSDFERACASVAHGFAGLALGIASAAGAVIDADIAFRRLWWSMLTPAQQRRHGKRLVREEIARRRMAKLVLLAQLEDRHD